MKNICVELFGVRCSSFPRPTFDLDLDLEVEKAYLDKTSWT